MNHNKKTVHVTLSKPKETSSFVSLRGATDGFNAAILNVSPREKLGATSFLTAFPIGIKTSIKPEPTKKANETSRCMSSKKGRCSDIIGNSVPATNVNQSQNPKTKDKAGKPANKLKIDMGVCQRRKSTFLSCKNVSSTTFQFDKKAGGASPRKLLDEEPQFKARLLIDRFDKEIFPKVAGKLRELKKASIEEIEQVNNYFSILDSWLMQRKCEIIAELARDFQLCQNTLAQFDFESKEYRNALSIALDEYTLFSSIGGEEKDHPFSFIPGGRRHSKDPFEGQPKFNLQNQRRNSCRDETFWKKNGGTNGIKNGNAGADPYSSLAKILGRCEAFLARNKAITFPTMVKKLTSQEEMTKFFKGAGEVQQNQMFLTTTRSLSQNIMPKTPKCTQSNNPLAKSMRFWSPSSSRTLQYMQFREDELDQSLPNSVLADLPPPPKDEKHADLLPEQPVNDSRAGSLSTS